MAAVTQNSVGPSLIESGATWLAKSIARRRTVRGQRGGVLGALGELLGTFAALACFVIAAFAAGFVIGMAVSGVALLLADFKVTVVRRSRAAQGRR